MLETVNITTEDYDILEGTGRSMQLKLFKPVGVDNCPVVVDLHGGAWTKGGYDECFERDEVLAKAGVAGAALDFRHAEHGYPSSSQDINYAIRWLKANAAKLGVDADRVGITGQSSGGHLAMLAAMRPFDERYTAIPLPAGSPDVDATVKCVCMTWPVINPLSRYHNALKHQAMAEVPKWVGDIPARHDLYWKTEEAMAEGNPMLMLERGEEMEILPAVWIQGRPDPVHDYRDPKGTKDLNEPDRFVENYRNAGGEIEIVDIEQSDRNNQSLEPVAAFFTKQFG